MENIEIPPFYVGQEVVANRNHSQGAYKRGDEFTITSIAKGCCQWELTIGIIHRSNLTECTKCNKIYPVKNREWLFDSSSFSPKN